MSVKIMSLVWEHAPCRENSLIVLLALADWANDDGTCWPSMQRLADKTRIDRRSAQRIIRRLKSDGLIKIEEGGGRSKQHRYQIETAALCRPLENSDVVNGDFPDTKRATLETERATFATETATRVSPDPLVDTLVDPSIEPHFDFIQRLKADSIYSHIDFDYQLGLMQRWLARPENKGRRMTERFVINWLNKIDRPVVIPTTSGNGTDRAAKEAELKHKMGWDRFERIG